jgi:hypothetical protein
MAYTLYNLSQRKQIRHTEGNMWTERGKYEEAGENCKTWSITIATNHQKLLWQLNQGFDGKGM